MKLKVAIKRAEQTISPRCVRSPDGHYKRWNNTGKLNKTKREEAHKRNDYK